ncbi:MAG TPA: hypothetical protein VNN80_10465, partial [Polyangiaceae bacterium]|nr:hypothetical protein [Polyangiaceae bacterium]
GEYTLRATVNPGFDFGERRTDNNSVDIQVSLPTTDLLSVCPGLDNRLVWQVGAQRDCGWVSGAFETCTPGATVDLGCPGCVGDAVLRVCEGNAPCTSEQALASGDDVDSADSCPATHFTCPRSGTYTWMHGPWFGDHLDPWTCEAHVLASAVGP